MIEVRCLHSLREAEPLRAAIDALNRAAPRPDPFSSFGYYENLLRVAAPSTAAGSVPELWLLLAFIDDELVGYLALKRSWQKVLGFRVAKLDLLTAFVADRPHLVARAEHEAAVSAAFYRYLLDRRQDWSLLEFAQQAPCSPLLKPPAEAGRGRLIQREWPNMPNATIPIVWASTAAYFAALSKKARSNVSRQLRALLAAGEVEVLSSGDAAARPPLFALYQRIEPHSWKTLAGGAIGSDPERLAFYRGLMGPEQPMQIHIQVLLLDGLPIAGLISGAFGDGLYALHIVYDDRVASLAPGSAIFWMGMRLAIEGGYRWFDLQWGFGYYKSRWLAAMTETVSLQIYRIDRPWFWRRTMGDLRRRFLGGTDDADTSRVNPARHRMHAADETVCVWAAHELADASERQRCATWRREALQGNAEILAGQALAAALPFATVRNVR